jgi:uncharacterized protein YyaL (SSP411 family)
MKPTPTHPANRLAQAASPYLLQHARNPVDWWPWGDEAFAEAARRDCPVFLSIGYATCHWCHVMERESFEDEGIAAQLNAAFVCVKVDREERPDVDHVYMSICQAATGSGGWPLTLFLTPDRRAFFAGTYFPPEGRGGRPGLRELAERVAELWAGSRERLLENAHNLTEHVRREIMASDGSQGEGLSRGRELLAAGISRLLEREDTRHGGFGSAPKFPMPHQLVLLLRQGRLGDAAAGVAARRALLAMARGGLHDQVGGGFHRYSTDARWLVPHFEKMLYDQAGMSLALTEALEDPVLPEDGALGEAAELRQALQGTLEHMLRDLRLPGGGLACGEDADAEGEEGRFHVWTAAEFRAVLDPERFPRAAPAWQVAEAGNWVDEAGRAVSILHRSRSWRELAQAGGQAAEDWRAERGEERRLLWEARERRPRPLLDDKVLTDWNGLAAAALLRAAASPRSGTRGQRLDWRLAGDETLAFVRSHLDDGQGGLLHRWHRGRAGVAGQLDDFAFVIGALLERAVHPGGGGALEEALRLQLELEARFADGGGLWFMAEEGGGLPVRPRDLYDGALPGGVSATLHNLMRLGCLLEREDLTARAQRGLAVLAGRFQLEAGGQPWALAALQRAMAPAGRLVVVGPAADPRLDGLLEVAFAARRPGLELLALDPGETARLAPGMGLVGGNPAAWLCDEDGCRPPATTTAGLADLLAGGEPRRDH